MILRSKFEDGKDLSSQHSLRPGTLLLYKLVFVGGPVLPRLMTSSEIKEGNGHRNHSRRASFCGSCVPNTTITFHLPLLRGKTV